MFFRPQLHCQPVGGNSCQGGEREQACRREVNNSGCTGRTAMLGSEEWRGEAESSGGEGEDDTLAIGFGDDVSMAGPVHRWHQLAPMDRTGRLVGFAGAAER